MISRRKAVIGKENCRRKSDDFVMRMTSRFAVRASPAKLIGSFRYALETYATKIAEIWYAQYHYC
jgi:hypothetical protein